MPRVLHVRSSGALLGAEQVVLELLKNSHRFAFDASLLIIKDPKDSHTELYRAARRMGGAKYIINSGLIFSIKLILAQMIVFIPFVCS